MDTPSPFKWRHFESEVILLCVRWYLRYTLSYRDVEELMQNADWRLTIPPSSDGSSGMLPSWTNAAGHC